MKRRAFLKGAGAVTVLVVGGGVWRAWDRGVFSAHSGPAFEAWKDWRGAAADGPLALVRAAILAANAMNSQPWLFKATATRIEIYADQGRNGGAFDPFLREMYISLGCALENLLLAAPAHEYQATLTLRPGALVPIPGHPQPQLAASIELAPGDRHDSDLFAAIPERHTNRFPLTRRGRNRDSRVAPSYPALHYTQRRVRCARRDAAFAGCPTQARLWLEWVMRQIGFVATLDSLPGGHGFSRAKETPPGRMRRVSPERSEGAARRCASTAR